MSFFPYKNLLPASVTKNGVEKTGMNPRVEKVKTCEKRPLHMVRIIY
jgi:hypothetical protein